MEEKREVKCPQCGGSNIQYYNDAAVVMDVLSADGRLDEESSAVVSYDDYHYECGDCQEESDKLEYFVADAPAEPDTMKFMELYGKTLDTIYALCMARVGKDNVHCVYSAYQTDADGLPINDLSDVAAWGVVQFYHDSWRSKVYQDPTWLDAFEAANEYCESHKRGDHIYFESIRYVETRQNIAQFRMGFGS